MPIVPALRKLRTEDQELSVNFGKIVRLCLKNEKTNKN